MKLAILGDTHFGTRNDNAAFHSIFEKFYSEVFFPILADRKVDALIQLGDLFDRRKYVNYLTLNLSKKYIFYPLRHMGITNHILLGNHCIFYKNTLEVNSPELLLKEYENIVIHKQPATTIFGSKKIDMVPWICKDNEEEIYEFVRTTKSNLCMGHFELNGFLMSPGEVCNSNMTSSFLSRYDSVFSGHFHQRSSKDNILYCGTPYHLTWADFEDERGFYILDTETDEIEFISNPYSVFRRIVYDENDDAEVLYHEYNNCYVKILVKKRSNEDKFNSFIDRIQEHNPITIQIIDDSDKIVLDDLDGEEISSIEDTSTIIRKYIKNLDYADSASLESLFNELYNTALNTD